MPSAFYAPLIARSSVMMTADAENCDSLVCRVIGGKLKGLATIFARGGIPEEVLAKKEA